MTRIPNHNEALRKLLRKLRPEKPETNGHAVVASPARTDEEIIEKARKERNGKFERLFNGNLSDYEGDHSRADDGFVAKLYSYTQDEEQIRRIHAASRLARGKSLDRDDYLQRSIDRASERVKWRYEWPKNGLSLSHSLSRNESDESPQSVTDLVQSIKATTLRGRGKPAPRGWVVANQIWEKHAACWYGEGGVAKSLLAMHLATHVASPELDYWLTEIPIKTAPVLCLDFELDESEQHRRLYEIAQGLGLEDVPENLYYIGATEYPPSAAFAAAAAEVERLGVMLVIVDSVGFAVEGDAEIAKDILSFHRTYLEPLKAAGASPLLIDHQAKIVKGEKYSDKTAFGSVYKTNAVRSMFQVRGGKSDAGITATFRHTKNNFGPKDEEFSVDVSFGPDQITVEQLEEAVPDPSREPTTQDLVLEALEDLGEATAADLTQATGKKAGSVANAVSELKSAGKVENTGKKRRNAHILRLSSHSHSIKESESLEGPGDVDPLADRRARWERRKRERREAIHANAPARYHELPINEKINLRAWVRENVVPQRTPHSSYALKHIAERDIGGPGYYVGNGELKGAMLEAGYTPLNTSRERGINFYFQAGPREDKE